MDRRIVAGMVGLALVGSSSTASAQIRDPNSTGTVGYSFVEPPSNRLNSTNPRAAVAPARVPTDPTTSGPAARVPTPPVGPNPVGLTTQPALAESLDQGYPTTGFGWFGRRSRAAASRKAARTNAPATSKYDPATVPAGMAWDEAGQNPTALTPADAPAGRPAPFVDEVPDQPRPQAPVRVNPASLTGDGSATLGRPAPFAAEKPDRGRPRLGVAGQTQPRPRLQSTGANNGRPVAPTATPDPAPLIPANLPDLDSIPAPAPEPVAAPRIEADPMMPPVPAAPIDRSPIPPAAPENGLLPLPEPPGAAPAALPDLTATPAAEIPALTPATTLESLPDPASAPLPDLVPGSAAVPVDPPPVNAASAGGQTPVPVDPALQRTSLDEPAALRIDKKPEQDFAPASARAAAVGDAVITVHEVETLVAEKYKDMTKGDQVPEQERRELINALGVMALDHLIDQTLILQAARVKLKNPKQKQQFDEFLDKRWRDEKLPGLLQQHNVTNEYELRKKLTADGKSYAEMQENYRRAMLEHEFLYNEIRNKINVDLVHLKAYYNQHRQEYDQPARISWREIEISVIKYPDRAAARRQADAIAARLRKEDFAAVATATSDGPTRGQGGLYADMTPGAYGIEPVNAVLTEIAEGTISPVIDAPNSFHIVRVEARRAAGPLRFDEVQKKVQEAVFEEGFLKARTEYLAKLRSTTLVRVMPMFERAKAREEQRQRRDEGRVVPASNR